MHDSAMRIGQLVMQTYCDLPNARILEIGSMDVNGSLRDFAEATTEYVGVDLEEGPSVDVVVKPGEKLPFDDMSFDLIMASSAFEHDPRFWETFTEMCRLVRPGGHIYVNAPSNGGVHRYPLDCWRFYPDAGLALAQYANDRGLEMKLVESFVGKRFVDSWDSWNDFVAIFRRGPSDAQLNWHFIYKEYPSTNVRTWKSDKMDLETGLTEDMELGRDLRQRIVEQTVQASDLQSEVAALSSSVDTLSSDLQGERNRVADLQQERAELRSSVTKLSDALQGQAETVDRLVKERIETQKIRDHLAIELRESRSEAQQLRVSSASLEQQVQALAASLQTQTKTFTRFQARDQELIGVLQTQMSTLKAETSAEISTLRARVNELDQALRQEALGRARNQSAMEWLRALQIALRGRPDSWALLPKKSRRAREYAMLRSVGLFDERSYLDRYPDVASTGMDALAHYVQHGLGEGRQR